jgi:hypothetical protein
MSKTHVVTYESSTGEILNVTPEQEYRLLTAGRWPKDRNGREFVKVKIGLHSGTPSYTDDEIEAMCRR